MTWDEVLKLPLGTKVKLSWWSSDYFIYKTRDQQGFISFRNHAEEVVSTSNLKIFDIQDKWDFYNYIDRNVQIGVSGLEALNKLMTFEWARIALNESAWREFYGFVTLEHSWCDLKEESQLVTNKGELGLALVPIYFNRYDWYEV